MVDVDINQPLEGVLEFDPSASGRNQFSVIFDSFFVRKLEIGAGRTDDLRNDDLFGSVDDESTTAGHHWDIAHINFSGLLFTGILVTNHEGCF